MLSIIIWNNLASFSTLFAFFLLKSGCLCVLLINMPLGGPTRRRQTDGLRKNNTSIFNLAYTDVDFALTSTTYLSIVATFVNRFFEILFPSGWYFSWQERINKATMVKRWFEQHKHKFEVLTFNLNYTHFNSIEPLWNAVDVQV